MLSRLIVLSLIAWLCVAAPAAAQEPAKDAAPPAVTVLRLTNNSLVVGTIVREEGDNVIFDAGALGQLTIAKSEIAAQLDPKMLAAALQAAPAAQGPPSAVTGFAPPGKVIWDRTIAATGYYTTPPYNLGPLDPRFPALTGKAMRLPGTIYQIQAQANITRATEHGQLFLEASDTYAYADNIGEQADNPRVSGGYNFRFGDSTRVFGVSRHTYYRDGIKKVDYSHQTILGVGIKAVSTPRVKLDLIPAFALQYDKKGTPFDGELLFGGGAMEVLEVKVGPYAQIENRLIFSHAFEEADYYTLESYVGFKGMVTKVVGLSVGWTYTLDNALGLRPTTIPANALFPGQPEFSVLANERSQSMFTSGLIIKF